MVSGHKKESLSGHIIQLSTWSWICNRLVRLLNRIFCGLRFILYFVLNIFKWKRQTGIWHENSRINPALSGWIITRVFSALCPADEAFINQLMRYYSNYVQLKHNSVFPTVHVGWWVEAPQRAHSKCQSANYSAAATTRQCTTRCNVFIYNINSNSSAEFDVEWWIQLI